MNIRRLFTPLLLVAISLPLSAQKPRFEPTPENSLLDGKTMVKVNPLGIIFGNYLISGERILARGVSVGLELGANFGGTDLGNINARSSYVSHGNVWMNQSNINFYTITPELRWYTKGGLGHGFYLTLFYRFMGIRQSNFYESFMIPDENNRRINGALKYGERSTAHTLGIGLGAQWLLGRRKNIVLDWYILGSGSGRLSGSINGQFSFDDGRPHVTSINKNELLSSLSYGSDIDVSHAEVTFDQPAQSFTISGLRRPVFTLRAGLSLGFRF